MIEEKIVSKTGIHLVVDYFTATFPFILTEDDYELTVIDEILKIITEFLGYTISDVELEEYAQHRFKYQYTIGSHITLRLLGPTLKSGHKSCSIELKGQGCREFENNNKDKTWHQLFEFFTVRLNAKPSRLDLALDDYDGKHITIQEVKEKLDNKEFSTSFRIKDYTLYNSANGMTLQFGSRTSTQMLVIYEKLKEQLLSKQPVNQDYWVRYEMRFLKEKAFNVVMNILNKEEDGLREFAFGLLYQMLDLKEKSNYNDNNVYKAQTYNKWSNFLSEVKKAKIERYDVRTNSYETYYKWASPLASSFFITIMLIKKNDLETTLIDIIQNAILAIDNLSNHKIKKINQYLKEQKLDQVKMLNIEQTKIILESYINEKELPF